MTAASTNRWFMGNLTRRRFVAGTSAAGLALLLPQRGRAAAAERLNTGFIGAGNIAGAHIGPILTQPDTQLVAVCDVNRARREAFAARVDQHYGATGCRPYHDFRELLAHPGLDAVVICTPDNWHALQVIAAARAGKHIYSEKPFARTVTEGRAMVDAVQRHGVVFQHGTQQRSDHLFRQTCELVRNGRLGTVHTVHVAAPCGQQGRTGTLGPIPADLDYDLWLGPAPWQPYSPERVDTSHWYFISDYSAGGYISGWGVHHVDICQWGLGTELTGPVELEGTGVFPTDGLCDTPLTWHVEYHFGGETRVIFTSDEAFESGVTFEGSRGKLWVTRGAWRAEPESLLREPLGPDDVRFVRSVGHERNWLDSIRSGAETLAPAEVGHRSQTICCLSDIAIRLGRKLRWDPKAERCVGDDAANRLLSRALREPWCL